jgi:hypothetical protein
MALSSCSDTSGVALQAQLLLQKKSMEQQSNVLQLVESAAGTRENSGPAPDGVRGKILDVIA